MMLGWFLCFLMIFGDAWFVSVVKSRHLSFGAQEVRPSCKPLKIRTDGSSSCCANGRNWSWKQTSFEFPSVRCYYFSPLSADVTIFPPYLLCKSLSIHMPVQKNVDVTARCGWTTYCATDSDRKQIGGSCRSCNPSGAKPWPKPDVRNIAAMVTPDGLAHTMPKSKLLVTEVCRVSFMHLNPDFLLWDFLHPGYHALSFFIIFLSYPLQALSSFRLYQNLPLFLNAPRETSWNPHEKHRGFALRCRTCRCRRSPWWCRPSYHGWCCRWHCHRGRWCPTWWATRRTTCPTWHFPNLLASSCLRHKT